MAFIVKDRIKETSTTTGTGTYALLGASANFAAFSAVMANNDTTMYAAVDTAAAGWEVGIGTWLTGNSLARTTVLASSNAGAAVSWAAGTRDVFLTIAGDRTVTILGANFTGAVSTPISLGSFTVPTANVSLQVSPFTLAGTSRATLQGTSIVRVIV